MTDIRQRAIRYEWADIAKGISIGLVVFFHLFPNKGNVLEATATALGKLRYVTWLLIYVRMPLFFFVAGLFSPKAVAKPWREFLWIPVLNFLWIYTLWSFILNIQITQIGGSRRVPVNWEALRTIYTEPAPILWFIYALAIAHTLRKLTLNISAKLVFPVLFGCYLYAWAYGQRTLFDLIAQLLPFFFIGYYAFDYLKNRLRAFTAYWPLGVIVYFASSHFLLSADLARFGALTFATSIVGILTVLLISSAIQATWCGQVARYFGQNSLYIYLMHRRGLLAAQRGLHAANIPLDIFSVWLVLLGGMLIPIALKTILLKCGLWWLFGLKPPTRES